MVKQQDIAPRGVIFSNRDQVAFVGMRHGGPLVLSPHLVTRIKNIGDRYGYWYEGDGGDIPYTNNFNRKMIYRGSWDDLFAKSVTGYPVEYIHPLFTNVEANKTANRLTDPLLTIFQSIMKNQKFIGYIKSRNFSENTLAKFLDECSEKGIDFMEMASKPALRSNVTEFLTEGENLMWPAANWMSYPNKAGKLAQKVTRQRDQFLSRQRTGVYFAGSGHLSGMVRVNTSLSMIDGRDAAK